MNLVSDMKMLHAKKFKEGSIKQATFLKSFKKEILELVELVETLRGPDGCPWDRKQTITTVKMYLLEECYEVMDAIDKEDYPEMSLELGDLLFMIVFLSQLSHLPGKCPSPQSTPRVQSL